MSLMDMMTPSKSEVSHDESVYKWPCAFNKFSTLPNAVGLPVYSDPFQIGNYRFKIRVYPGGFDESSKEYVAVYLEICQPSPKPTSKYGLSILINTEKHCEHRSIKDLSGEMIGSGWSKFVKRTELLADVLSCANDQLIVLTELFDLDLPTSPYHLHKIRKYERFMNNEELSDVKIIVEGQTIFAHKVILSCGNQVFSAMFTHNVRENSENILNIDDIEYQVMLELMRFIYCGQVRDIEKMPRKLLIAADKYGVVDLMTLCEEYLCQLFSVENVLDYLNFADKYNAGLLRAKAISFFIIHRKDVTRNLELKSALEVMDADSITELLVGLC